MSIFKLTYGGDTVLIHDTDVMEPGELSAMKHLAGFGKFGLERSPKDVLPPAPRDQLDDIAEAILAGGPRNHSPNIYRQAKERMGR